jgi:hypothetical protein
LEPIQERLYAHGGHISATRARPRYEGKRAAGTVFSPTPQRAIMLAVRASGMSPSGAGKAEDLVPSCEQFGNDGVRRRGRSSAILRRTCLGTCVESLDVKERS